MKYHQLIKLSNEITEEHTKHLTLQQKVLHSFPGAVHFDKGEVTPYHRIIHNVELKHNVKNNLDIAKPHNTLGKDGHGLKPIDYDQILKPQ